jgi:hypothetical protein
VSAEVKTVRRCRAVGVLGEGEDVVEEASHGGGPVGKVSGALLAVHDAGGEVSSQLLHHLTLLYTSYAYSKERIDKS